MALLWIVRRADLAQGPEPEIVELAAAPFDLGARCSSQLEVCLVPFDRPARFAVVADQAAPLRVNGMPPVAGARVLQHQDSLHVGAELIAFFSAHSPPRVVEFREEDRGRLDCPLCDQPLRGPSVCCPVCHVWFHETPEYPCWSAGASCPSCGEQSTALDGEPDWVPDPCQEGLSHDGFGSE